MPNDERRWTLEDLIDFESEVSAAPQVPPGLVETVAAAVRGLDGAAARRAGFRIWLDGRDGKRSGKKFSAALAMTGSALALLMFLTGISGVLGVLDRARAGVHVTLFLAVIIGVQWVILILAGLAWALRGKAAEGFSLVQTFIGRLALRLAGQRDAAWWSHLMDGGGAVRAAVLWRLARMAQVAGIAFNLGVLAGLAGLVLVRHVGFFWETTTELAMHTLLEHATAFLSIPWAAWWPGSVPDAAVIEASRWRPADVLPPGPAAWWQFLLMTTLVWGLLPRLVLWCAAWWAGRRALEQLDFQSRAHRGLWRELTGAGRVEMDDKPMDGVLVLDVGGSGLDAAALRPFLLRRLRVHPAAWHSVAVLDPGAEAEAEEAMKKAPAGVVLLAEGWALSPVRMSALHGRIRAAAGPQLPVKFLIANSLADHAPVSPSSDERREWERFVDSLRDPEAEVFFYEDLQPAL